MNHHQFQIDLPEWAIAEHDKLPQVMPTMKERMSHVIRFSKLNVDHDTGGPFAAGVFEKESGKLVVIGVNRVVPTNCSAAHAEMVAISLAQKILGTFDLGGPNMPVYQLVVNWRPCVMCYGALHWSGIRSLSIAGDSSEVEEITGFDEGPIHPNWREELENNGIEVQVGVMKAEALEVFKAYKAAGGLVYNGRSNG